MNERIPVEASLLPSGQSAKDDAIEFGEFLARAAELYRNVSHATDPVWADPEVKAEALRRLNNAIDKFRQRAATALLKE